MLEYRRLGSQGLTVPAVGLGCMGMTGAYGKAEEAESVATIRRALEIGVTMFDTADVYSSFANEKLVGRALAGRRDQAVVATKFGGAELDSQGAVVGGVNGRPEYVRACVERSLRHLGTDWIDVYYQHRVDPKVPVEETFGALGELVSAGKLRYLGVSEARPDTIRRAHATAPLSVVESEYSLFAREMETNGVLETTRELGIGFVAYAPLGRGFLTGAVRSRGSLAEGDLRCAFPRFEQENLATNLRLLERVEKIAAARQATAASLALAWLLARGPDIVAIPGARRRTHLEANARSGGLRLDDATLRALDDAVTPAEIAGPRTSPHDTGIEL